MVEPQRLRYLRLEGMIRSLLRNGNREWYISGMLAHSKLLATMRASGCTPGRHPGLLVGSLILGCIIACAQIRSAGSKGMVCKGGAPGLAGTRAMGLAGTRAGHYGGRIVALHPPRDCTSASGAGGRSRARMGSGIVAARLMIEPQDGVRPLIRAIDRAQERIFVETYILTDQRVIRALERASAQGVGVYVLLERQPLGMGRQPERVAELLRAAGVFVRWSPSWFRFTHAKLLVLDDRIAVVSTANLSRSGFARNREVLLVDDRRRDVHEISALFRVDWDHIHSHVAAGEPNVVVAPDDARAKLSKLVQSAKRQIDVYAEEIADRGIEQMLVRMQRRGVRVRVILPWSARFGDARRLARSGVGVRLLVKPYAHAKVIVADAREAFAGSENLSSTSLDRNREIGVLLRGSAPMRLHALFESDWRRARPLS